MLWGRGGLLSWMICIESQQALGHEMQVCRKGEIDIFMGVNSLNLVESLLLIEGEKQGQRVYSASWGPTLEQIA